MNNKLRILLMYFILLVGIFLFVESIVLSEILPMDRALVLTVLGGLIFILGVVIVMYMDFGAGIFKCRNCGHKFKPTFKEYICSIHVNTTRRLKCPDCKEKTWCRMEIYDNGDK